MNKIAYILFPIMVLTFGGCTSVKHGPVNPPSHCRRPDTTTYIDEPQPAPITEKNIPAGQSSLKKTGPDETITK